MRFPSGFLWGVSTSAFQIEGAFGEDGRGASIWDDVAADGSGVTAARADDDYHRWREDVALIERSGASTYRFSVAWPRVMPEGTGRVNGPGLDFYDRLVDALLAAKVTPIVCLHHWDLPVALQQRGGWLNRDIVGHFVDYAAAVIERLGDRVTQWIAINEAYSIAYGGYGIAEFPPFLRDEKGYFAAAHHLNLAQGAAFKALEAPGRRFGTAMCLYPVHPSTPSPEDVAAARFHEAMSTKLFLDPLLRGQYSPLVASRVEPFLREGDLGVIQHPVDFIGINYYEPEYRRAAPDAPFGTAGTAPEGRPTTDAGWLIEPAGLYQQLIELRDRYGNPTVYITENGAAFTDRPDASGRIDDRKRIAFLRDHIAAAHRALSEGTKLAGYFVWSILDNFEWRHGFDLRFGLVRVDVETERRVPKSSFDWYGQVARTGVVRLD